MSGLNQSSAVPGRPALQRLGMSRPGRALWIAAAVAGAAALLAGCGERPPVEPVQLGYRGTGMETVYNPRLVESIYASQQLPPVQPAAPAEGPRANQVYQNVQVLGNLSVGEFTRVMLAMTQWVAPPEQACNYCHGANMADESKYTYQTARKMLQMTLHTNAQWKSHVGNTGVTCYTCHAGRQVPQYAWYVAPPEERNGLMATNAMQNRPAQSTRLTTLPYDPFTPFLLEDEQIRVIGNTALPTGNRQSIKQTEWTYALMVHFSNSLGVSCLYCHNSRSFARWQESPPQRTTAWYGIRMVRDLNANYVVPLTGIQPKDQLGPTGDIAKINCSTCHRGVYKPLFGQPMLKDYPELSGSYPAAAPTAPVDGAPVDGAPADAAPGDGAAPGATPVPGSPQPGGAPTTTAAPTPVTAQVKAPARVAQLSPN